LPKTIEPGTHGFDFTGQIRRLADDMVARLDELGHIDLDRVAIRFLPGSQSGPPWHSG